MLQNSRSLIELVWVSRQNSLGILCLSLVTILRERRGFTWTCTA